MDYNIFLWIFVGIIVAFLLCQLFHFLKNCVCNVNRGCCCPTKKTVIEIEPAKCKKEKKCGCSPPPSCSKSCSSSCSPPPTNCSSSCSPPPSCSKSCSSSSHSGCPPQIIYVDTPQTPAPTPTPPPAVPPVVPAYYHGAPYNIAPASYHHDRRRYR